MKWINWEDILQLNWNQLYVNSTLRMWCEFPNPSTVVFNSLFPTGWGSWCTQLDRQVSEQEAVSYMLQ